MVLHTWLTRSLGIRHPIIQGGMHHVGFAELAAAVSNAGGLGIITALTQPSADALRDEIQKTKELTDKVKRQRERETGFVSTCAYSVQCV